MLTKSTPSVCSMVMGHLQKGTRATSRSLALQRDHVRIVPRQPHPVAGLADAAGAAMGFARQKRAAVVGTHAVEGGAAQEVRGLDDACQARARFRHEADLLRAQRAGAVGVVEQVDLADEVGDEAGAWTLV